MKEAAAGAQSAPAREPLGRERNALRRLAWVLTALLTLLASGPGIVSRGFTAASSRSFIERVYNVLYLVYMAIFSIAFWALVYQVAALCRRAIRVHLPQGVRLASASGALLQPLMLYPLWIGQPGKLAPRPLHQYAYY